MHFSNNFSSLALFTLALVGVAMAMPFDAVSDCTYTRASLSPPCNVLTVPCDGPLHTSSPTTRC